MLTRGEDLSGHTPTIFLSFAFRYMTDFYLVTLNILSSLKARRTLTPNDVSGLY